MSDSTAWRGGWPRAAGDAPVPQTGSVSKQSDDPGPKAAGTGGFSRQAISRLITPFTAQQQKINDQLFAAVRTLGEKLGGLVPRVEAADRLVAETRALPYVSGSPFEIFEEPVAGRVQGYGRRNGDPGRAGTYDAFEDIFRGPELFIRDRQRRYLDILGDREPVLDIGCGRGEFLDLLRERGRKYAGIDPDPDMVGRCRAKGHERVEVADANSYLEKCEDDSIGAIFCAQVIEHMPYEELLRFYGLGLQKLRARRTLYPGDRKPALCPRVEDLLGRPHPPASALPRGGAGALRDQAASRALTCSTPTGRARLRSTATRRASTRSSQRRRPTNEETLGCRSSASA